MSLLPTMIWLNIPFSPQQNHMRLPPPPQKQNTVYRLGQYHGAMIGQREKSLPHHHPAACERKTAAQLRPVPREPITRARKVMPSFTEPIDFVRWGVTLMPARKRRQPFPTTFTTAPAECRFPLA